MREKREIIVRHIFSSVGLILLTGIMLGALPVAVNKSYLTLITLQRDNPNFNGIVGTLQPIYFPSRKIVAAQTMCFVTTMVERAAAITYRPTVYIIIPNILNKPLIVAKTSGVTEIRI